MNSYIATTVVGSADGQFTNDIEQLIDKEGKLVIDEKKAIREIMVRHNGGPVNDTTVIFGLNFRYKLKDSSELREIRHGYQAAPITSVGLGDSEVLVGIFGRTGYDASYGFTVIGSIGFTIFDAKTATVRVAGPYGLATHDTNTEWEPFNVSDVMAIGAYARAEGAPILTGLVFYKYILSA